MKRGILSLIIIFLLCGFAKIELGAVETALINKDYTLVKNLASQFLSLNPSRKDSNKASYYLGIAYVKLNEHRKAKSAFSDVLNNNPLQEVRDKSYLGLFDNYFIQEQYQSAHKVAQDLMRLSPRTEFKSSLYLKLAKACMKLALWNEAQGYLEKIMNGFPGSVEMPYAKQLSLEKHYFSVQVGAFMERGKSEKLLLELQQKGEYAYIVETVDEQKRTFFRVRVGKIAVFNEAKRLKNKLSKDGYPAKIYP